MLRLEREHPAVGLSEPGRVALLLDFPKDGGVYGGDNVGEGGLTIDRAVPRSRLVPIYGSGWQPA